MDSKRAAHFKDISSKKNTFAKYHMEKWHTNLSLVYEKVYWKLTIGSFTIKSFKETHFLPNIFVELSFLLP